MSSKIECIPDTFEVLHCTLMDAEITRRASVTLRAIFEGGQRDFELTPDAARRLSDLLQSNADSAEEPGDDE